MTIVQAENETAWVRTGLNVTRILFFETGRKCDDGCHTSTAVHSIRFVRAGSVWSWPDKTIGQRRLRRSCCRYRSRCCQWL